MTKPQGSNPLSAIMAIRRSELPLALLMFGYFFLVITSFWVLKPIKKALFIEFYDKGGFELFSITMRASQAELVAKVLNMLVAFLAVVVFTWLVRRFRRQHLTYIFSLFFVFCYIYYTFVIDNPGDLTVWSFYLFGDLFNTVMVATFFAFLNDSVTPNAAKRMYGLVVLGGVAGGAFGTLFVRVWIASVHPSGWLWICLGMVVLIALIAMAAGRMVGEEKEEPKPAQAQPSKSNGNPALEGARLVFRSKYLVSIVAIVGLYEIVSTLMDFQFTETISHYLDGPAIGEQFSLVYLITNLVSMFIQLFLTSYIMTRFGVKVALMIMPIAILIASGGFLVAPLLWIGSSLNTADNGLNYSINQSAKEALYVPTTREEKYKAKAFIDMFVQRFAKAVAVGISLGITAVFQDFSSIRWLSLITVAVVVVWLIAARYAGRRFDELTAGETD